MVCSCYTVICSSLSHVAAIEEIVRCARCELELEEQFYSIEEEWNEQVINMRCSQNGEVEPTTVTRSNTGLPSSFRPGATVQSIQVTWAPPSGWGPHPLPPGAAGACPDAASHDAYVPPHSASEGRDLALGHQAGQHCRGAPTGEREVVQAVCTCSLLRLLTTDEVPTGLTNCIIVLT